MRRGTATAPHMITPETNLIDEVGIDSLEITELVFHLEERTGLRLPLEHVELSHFRRVGDLAELILGTPQ